MISLIEKKTILVVILVGILVCGCSTNTKPINLLSKAQAPPSFKITTNTYWWNCSFQVVWPEDAEINWGMDLLIAHAVVSPVLVKHINNITYWRFHRRAARDDAGHQFSFIFYSKPEIASIIYSELAKSNLLMEAYEANLIKSVLFDNPDHLILANVEDTSDPRWSPGLQRNWPSFIMGTSSLWLGLIDDSMQDYPGNYTDIHLLLQNYREVDDKITGTWRTEGQHALLHHLNAIFGYEPLQIRKALSF